MFLVRDSKRNVFGKGGKVSRIYMKNFRHLMFLVMKIAKLQREHPDTHGTGGFRRRQ